MALEHAYIRIVKFMRVRMFAGPALIQTLWSAVSHIRDRQKEHEVEKRRSQLD